MTPIPQLAYLKKQLEKEKAKEQKRADAEKKIKQLKKEVFMLKHRKGIAAVKLVGRSLAWGGKQAVRGIRAIAPAPKKIKGKSSYKTIYVKKGKHYVKKKMKVSSPKISNTRLTPAQMMMGGYGYSVQPQKARVIIPRQAPQEDFMSAVRRL